MPRTSQRSRLRRALALVVASIIVAAGATAVLPAQDAEAAPPPSLNPLSMNGGFTVYAREDATLGNTETEGSIAAGGQVTKPGDGQYTLVHVVAGTGDYVLPTVDGDPSRLLAGSYDPASGGITAITSAGTSDPSLFGDLKLVDRDGPFEAFTRASWLRLNTDPGNPDATPLIDATHQVYPDDAEPPTSAVGAGSIYTWDTSASAVSNYVEAGREASYEDAASCLADLADATTGIGFPVPIAEDAGDRIVLGPLSADQPNVVDYTDIAGASLLQFAAGPTPGAANPLVIRVPAGTTDVVGARVDPQGAYSPYTFWDLSALSGDVTVTAAQGRMDGSIYAPDANVTVDAAPLDGQVLGNDVTLLGGEVHSFLFAGQIPCQADSGTFRVQKDIEGVDPAQLPAGMMFTVNYSAQETGGTVRTGSLILPASGDWVDAGEQFPVGTVVDFEEIRPARVPGYIWTAPVITPDPLTITAGSSADVTVTNTAVAVRGSFTVRKVVSDGDRSTADPVATGSVPVTWTSSFGPFETGTGVMDVPLDGSPVGPGRDFFAGARITFTEDLSTVTPPPGYVWGSASWNPGDTIVIEPGTNAEVVLTNTAIPDTPDRTISVVKETTGEAADPAYDYSVSYNTDPAPSRTTVDLPVGEPVVLSDVEAGASELSLAEEVPQLNGVPVDTAGWELPVFRVTVDGVTTETTATGWGEPVSIPLSGSGDISISVVNDVREGTFQVTKALVGIAPTDLPAGTTFPVTWTATTPAGETSTGTLDVPAGGAAVGPVDVSGAAVTFPYGTSVTLAEDGPPTSPYVTWISATFTPKELVIGEAGADTVTTTLTNTAEIAQGTFAVQKELSGIAADQVLGDDVRVAYVAILPDRTAVAGLMEVPVDGTPASPTDSAGAAIEFPIGTHIGVVEEPLDDSLLPPGYQWGAPVWPDGASLTITEATQTTPLTVSNTAVELLRYELTKVVVGEGEVPEDTAFTVEAWIDDEEQPPVTVAAGETVTSPELPVGSIVEVAEPTFPETPGVIWATPTWTVDGEALPVESNGRVVLPAQARDADTTVAVELTNTAASAATGAFEVEKVLTGTAASSVPDDAAFTIEYEVDGAAAVQATVRAGEPFVVSGLPADASVRIREVTPSATAGVAWGSPTWTAAGEPLPVDDDGWVTLRASATEVVSLVLTNRADAPAMPATGGDAPVLLALAGLLLLGGGWSLLRRHRSKRA